MPDHPIPDGEIAAYLSSIALRAGAKALEIYHSDFAVGEKADASPVTAADRFGEEIILAGLAARFPTIPALAEERASEGRIPALGNEFFLVDPLDGTREFVNKTGEFTVNIALIREGRAVLGVVHAPATGRLYAGAAGAGAWVREAIGGGSAGAPQPIKARPVPDARPVAVASRSHRSAETDAWLEEIGAGDFAAAGSSLKFCLIAEGKADVYPRFGRTMEWDTAAGQAVLEAAGGAVLTRDGGVLAYGKSDRGFENPHFIAWGARADRAGKDQR